MKPKHVPLALALALALGALAAGCTREGQPGAEAAVDAAAALGAADAHADAPAHDDGDAGQAMAIAQAAGTDFPVPAGHVPWTPDAPLVEGMSRVRTAIGALEAHPDVATVRARAADVDAAIEDMFDNCSLDTEPDLALHAILARLMAGTRALGADPADRSPVADMHAALENYRRLFDDPAGDPAAPPGPAATPR